MKTYTVKQVARISGVSVRALHHYDEIGLLKPAFIGTNRYRHYGTDELLRLQQILIHRALGIPLSDIAALLDGPGVDRLKALTEQRQRIEKEAQRYAEMLRTIDRTIAALNGYGEMSESDLYAGLVSAEKQAEYETWLVEKYGEPMRGPVEAGRRKMGAMSKAEMAAHMAELAEIEGDLAGALRQGIAADAPALAPLLARHRAWVGAAWAEPPTPEQYAGLAETYQAHPDFVARYEAIELGFGVYLADAMKAWAARQAG